MIWYDREIIWLDGSGRLVGEHKNGTTTIQLHFDDELDGSVTIFEKTFRALIVESPSAEEVINKFGSKVIRLERMIKEMTKTQIAKKRWAAV